MPRGTYVRTEAHRERMRGNQYAAGLKPWNKGKRGVQPVSDETRAKLSIARVGNQNAAGAKNASWKGGIYLDNIKNGVYVKRRRARLAGAEGSHTQAEWLELIEQCGGICVCCKEKKPLTRDHITPISKGGSDYISNIQPLCVSCNSRKRDRVHSYLGNS